MLAPHLITAASGPKNSNFTFEDTFTNIDVNTMPAADTGQAATVHTGTWGIRSNKGALVTQSGDSVVTWDCGKSDFDLSCDMLLQGNPGVVFRATNDQNYLLAFLSTINVQIWKRVAGSYTNLTNINTTLTNGTTYTLRVTGSGTLLTFYVAVVGSTPALLGTVTTSQFQTNTRIGLRQNDGSASRYDNLRVI